MGNHMAFGMRDNLTRLVGAAAIAAVVSVPVAAPASADSAAFKALKGSWRGSGIVTPSKGGRERVSCRVKYGVLGNNLTQSIKCAGTDYRINVNSNLTIRGDNITGSWIETNNDYSGGAAGSVKGNTIDMRIFGVSFNGTMNIKVQGRKQRIVITRYDPASKKYATMANISLRK